MISKKELTGIQQIPFVNVALVGGMIIKNAENVFCLVLNVIHQPCVVIVTIIIQGFGSKVTSVLNVIIHVLCAGAM